MELFGPMPQLLAVAEVEDKLRAFWAVCREWSSFS
jgi:thymidine kinase